MTHPDLSELNVAEIMSIWPGTIAVFIELDMYCVGCPIGIFHTLDDAAREHGLDRDVLLQKVVDAMGSARPARRRGLRRSAPDGADPSPAVSGARPPRFPHLPRR